MSFKIYVYEKDMAAPGFCSKHSYASYCTLDAIKNNKEKKGF